MSSCNATNAKAKCMISTQPCSVCGKDRRPAADSDPRCSSCAEAGSVDILADLTAEELRCVGKWAHGLGAQYLFEARTSSPSDVTIPARRKAGERWTEIAERFEQVAKERGK